MNHVYPRFAHFALLINLHLLMKLADNAYIVCMTLISLSVNAIDCRTEIGDIERLWRIEVTLLLPIIITRREFNVLFTRERFRNFARIAIREVFSENLI